MHSKAHSYRQTPVYFQLEILKLVSGYRHKMQWETTWGAHADPWIIERDLGTGVSAFKLRQFFQGFDKPS